MTTPHAPAEPELIHLRPWDRVFRINAGPRKVLGEDCGHWGVVRDFDQISELRIIPIREKFEDSREYRAFHDVFVKGRKWEETDFYKHIIDDYIAKGKPMWRCRTEEQFRKRLRRDVGKIYRNMLEYGFLSQAELLAMQDSADDGRFEQDFASFKRKGYISRISRTHEIMLGINETGTLLFLDGRHRLGIARILGIEDIPVRIVFRQRRWHDLRSRLAGLSGKSRDGRYLVIDHPDLAHISIPAQVMDAALAALRGCGLKRIKFEMRYTGPSLDQWPKLYQKLPRRTASRLLNYLRMR